MAEGSGYNEYVAGLLAGVSIVIVGHPFDTVKVKLQKHNAEGNGMKYKSSCTVQQEYCRLKEYASLPPVKGLYRGATSSFLGMAFESYLAFGIYSQMKQFLQGGLSSEKPQPQAIVPSAACAGAIISFILCPSELIKNASSRNRLFPKLHQIQWSY